MCFQSIYQVTLQRHHVTLTHKTFSRAFEKKNNDHFFVDIKVDKMATMNEILDTVHGQTLKLSENFFFSFLLTFLRQLACVWKGSLHVHLTSGIFFLVLFSV